MKIKFSILFSLMTFFIVTMSIIETHNFSMLQHEITIDSMGEFEKSESEPMADIADLVKRSTILKMYYKSSSFFHESFAHFTLTKGIFRPPCLV